MRKRRMLPPRVASTVCPLGNVTRNVALGSTSVTVPSSWMASSFAILSRSNLRDVLRRRPFLALHDIELDAVTLGERLESVALDRGVVDETVLAAAVRGD